MKRKTKNNYFRKVSVVFGVSVLISILLVTGFYFRQKSSPSVLGESAPPTVDPGNAEFSTGSERQSNYSNQAYDISFTGTNISVWPYNNIVTWKRLPDYKGRYASWYNIQVQNVNTKNVIHSGWYVASDICSGTTCNLSKYLNNGRYDVAVRAFYSNATEYSTGYYLGYWAVWNPYDLYERDIVLNIARPSVQFNLVDIQSGTHEVKVHIDKLPNTTWYLVWDNMTRTQRAIGPYDFGSNNYYEFVLKNIPYGTEVSVWVQGWGPWGLSESLNSGWYNQKKVVAEPQLNFYNVTLSTNLQIGWSHPVAGPDGIVSAAQWYRVVVANGPNSSQGSVVYDQWVKANDASTRPVCGNYGNCVIQVQVNPNTRYWIWVQPYYTDLNPGYFGSWKSTVSPEAAPLTFTQKVLNLIFIPSGITPLYNPQTLTNQLVSTMKTSSGNAVTFQIVDTQTVPRSPTKNSLGKLDYNALLDEFNICQRLNSGLIDEVWVWVNGADGEGYEYVISGDIQYGPSIRSCGKNLAIMGFDYTRPYSNAMHSMGHRMERLASRYDYVNYNDWDTRFYRYDVPYGVEIGYESGNVGCGNVHFPPNGSSHYDYSDTNAVTTKCGDSLRTITCNEWGCNEEGYLKWWYSHIKNYWWGYFLLR